MEKAPRCHLSTTSTTSLTWDWLILASLWCISLFIVNPLGNFPLNDDWSYGLTVKHMIENGDYRPTIGWHYMSLITNVLWGSLFCIPFGFSFTALRLSTSALSLLGILGGHFLLRDLGVPRWQALIAIMTLAFNPVYYALSNTFMTDVPFTALLILAAVFFARNLKTDSNIDLFIGTILAAAAILSRQLAISVPLAFSVSLVMTRGRTYRSLLRAAGPPALCLGVLLVFQHWLRASARIDESFFDKTNDLLYVLQHPTTQVWIVANNIYVGLLYLGLFLMPVLIFVGADILWPRRKHVTAIFTLTLVAILSIFGIRILQSGKFDLMPMSGNILVGSGIGPLTLRDVLILNLPHVSPLPMSFWCIVTAMSLLGATLLITALVVRAIDLMSTLRRNGKIVGNEAVRAFLLLSVTIYLLPVFPSYYFDRWLIPAILFLAAGLADVPGHFPRFSLVQTRILRLTSFSLLTAFSIFALGTTKDYLSWNRVRWKALHNLMEVNHIGAENIDGGFEFNGLYLYDPHYSDNPKKSWWWVQGDGYQIGFGNIPGYKIIKEYSYPNWIPPRTGRLVVLQEDPQPSQK